MSADKRLLKKFCLSKYSPASVKTSQCGKCRVFLPSVHRAALLSLWAAATMAAVAKAVRSSSVLLSPCATTESRAQRNRCRSSRKASKTKMWLSFLWQRLLCCFFFFYCCCLAPTTSARVTRFFMRKMYISRTVKELDVSYSICHVNFPTVTPKGHFTKLNFIEIPLQNNK